MKHSRHFLTGVFLFLFSAGSIADIHTVSGYVRTGTGTPVAGCIVTDGFSVVQTDEAGAYGFARNDSAGFVYLTVPAAYEISVDENNLPLFYKRITESQATSSYDFTLTPFADGGTADRNHILIAIADPQVQNAYDTWRFGNESIRDIREHLPDFPEGTPVYSVVLGDMVWDEYHRFPEHTAQVKQLGIPVFHIIGNHDHDPAEAQGRGTDYHFKEHYGPTYYSFDRGDIHYVALDNIEYTSEYYSLNIADHQLHWLKKDLALVPDDRQIVFLIHGPLARTANSQAIYDLVHDRPNTHALSGHTHTLINHEISPRFYDHTVGAIQGTFWSGDYCADGTPNGYGVFMAGAGGYTSWYYKATGHDKQYQLRAYPPGSFTGDEEMSGKVIANIWNYDSQWGEVYIYENGERNRMTRYTGKDPLIWDFMLEEGDTRPNYPGTDGGTEQYRNPGTQPTDHLFYYTPEDPGAGFVVEVTDRNDVTYRVPVLKNLMVACFEKEEEAYLYRQDFHSYREFPNQYVSPDLQKCTYVQGHSLAGWYACTSGSSVPGPVNTSPYTYFNYLLIDNGSASGGGLYAYGEGDPDTPQENDPDRSLGMLTSPLHRHMAIGLLLENNTGKTLEGLLLEYTGKRWRTGDHTENVRKMPFSYVVNPDVLSLRKRTVSIAEVETTYIDSLSLLSPEATCATAGSPCNGNDPANQRPVHGKIDITLSPGEVILLRWEDTYDEHTGGTALALDNLTVKAVVASGTATEKTERNLSFYNKGPVLYFDEVPGVISVYDYAGMLVKQIDVPEKRVDLSSFVPAGMYMVKTGVGTRKINISDR